MTLAVQTNVTSLHIQRRLTNNNSKLSNNFRRLATGMKTITAADNASGMAISERLVANVNGISQAMRNANDGISMAQTAETGLEDVRDILQRLGELAMQSSNDSNSASDRQAIQQEADDLIAEVENIATSTEFNGKKLLDGSLQDTKIHIGAGSSQSVGFSVESVQALHLGSVARVDSGSVTDAALSEGDLVLNGQTVRASDAVDDTLSFSNQAASAIAKAAAINSSSVHHGVTAIVNANTATGSAEIADSGGTLDGTNYIEINGVRIQGEVSNDDADGKLRAAINAVSGQTGVVASLDDGAGGDKKLVLTATDGRNITVAAGGTGETITGLSAGTSYGTIQLESDREINITSNGSAANAGLSTGITQVNRTNNLSTIDLTTQTGSVEAIAVIQKASSQVSGQVARLGATFKWLESSVNNLSNQVQNVADARARIVDVDVASETADLSKSQILTEVTSSMLAQANVSQDGVLKLL